MKFDVHLAGMIGGTALGQLLDTIDAADHRAAKTAAAKLHPCVRTVVMPHRPTNGKLERAIQKLDQRKPRDRQRFGNRRR